MGVSRRSYAAQRGVSEAAVRKAIATGRITTLPDGTIDPARADSEWGAQTDPAKQRGQHAKQMGADTAAGTARAAATKPVPQAAIRAVADTLRDAGTDPGSPEATGGEVSFLRARMANEVLKAQTAKVRLEKMKAEVIDRARATAMVFDLATDSLFADQNFAVDALLRLGGTDPAQAIRVIRAMPDQFASFGEGRFVVDTVLLNIRLADAPVLSAGDTVEIAGQLHEVQGIPARDSDRLVWLAEARAL